MDWKKVNELRKKVLAEEEDLVDSAIKGDKTRQRVGPAVHHSGKPSGVRDLEEERDRAASDKYSWDPERDAKKTPTPGVPCKKCGKKVESDIGRKFNLCDKCIKAIMEGKTCPL